jgi:branched-chain amino acid transport system ATP-binding protein
MTAVPDVTPVENAREAPRPLLETHGVRKQFGGVNALVDAAIRVQRGEMHALIGPNGAGKTTLFNCITRISVPEAGVLSFDGHDLLRKHPHELASLGMSRTFQNLALVPELSVHDNVLIGCMNLLHPSWRDVLHRGALRRREAEAEEIVADVLGFLGLAPLADHECRGLPFGTLKRVELARALAARPQLLLLDEPANGLVRSEADELGDLLLSIREEHGCTVVLVEHHMRLVMRIADRITVLAAGSVLAEGTPEAIRHSDDVIRAYFGSKSV